MPVYLILAANGRLLGGTRSIEVAEHLRTLGVEIVEIRR